MLIAEDPTVTMINMSNVSKYKCNMIILSLIENELFLTTWEN
jgi:hypothetical protein